ncbi:hypothetical protein ACJMK2_010288 [Sinanodonta woodiana]|uniref:Cytochrome b5 heme-binding domain-containing protein n=1 Tax=Sinanodonta woodiana TaxID=1069815 RepID=A0ABD3VH97_SINWO
MEQNNSKRELPPLFEKPVHKQYSRTEVSNHCDASSCWIVLDNKIYDVTEFLSKHPGGPDIILENAGRDATVPFKDKGHSMDAIRLIDQYYIGDLTVSDRLGRH